MRHRRLSLLAFFVGLCFVLFFSGCSGGSGDDGDVSRFSGTYSGTFTGNDSGTFTLIVTDVGTLTGSGNSNTVGSFNATGIVENNGDLEFGIATTGAMFTGRISEAGALSGAWVNGTNSGIFSGARQ